MTIGGWMDNDLLAQDAKIHKKDASARVPSLPSAMSGFQNTKVQQNPEIWRRKDGGEGRKSR